jgi:excisionase family DNA binding protein
MAELITAPVKVYRKQPSPLLAQMQRCIEVRREIISDPLLTTGDVRTLIGCSYSHLRHLILTNQLAIWRPNPRAHIRIKQSEVLRYLASGFNGGQNG